MTTSTVPAVMPMNQCTWNQAWRSVGRAGRCQRRLRVGASGLDTGTALSGVVDAAESVRSLAMLLGRGERSTAGAWGVPRRQSD